MSKLSRFFFGQKEKFYGMPQWQNLNAALQGQGAPGAFGQAADYYRSNLGDTSADMQAFEAPLRREFQEDILPGIAEQFAGMGSGSLSSSGARNTALRAGTALGERIAAIRSGLRMQSANNLAGLGQFGISSAPFRPETGGFLGGIAGGVGQSLGMLAGGPAANFALNGVSSLFGNQSPSYSANPLPPRPPTSYLPTWSQSA